MLTMQAANVMTEMGNPLRRMTRLRTYLPNNPMSNSKLLLEKIFRDAVIIDVDFTDWNDKIVLGVIACSASMVKSGKQRVFLVEFYKTSQFQCSFNHFATRRKMKVHFVWRIDKLRIVRNGRSSTLMFRYYPDFPELHITFEKFKIIEVETKVLDKCFPGWASSGSGLASVTIRKAIAK